MHICCIAQVATGTTGSKLVSTQQRAKRAISPQGNQGRQATPCVDSIQERICALRAFSAPCSPHPPSASPVRGQASPRQDQREPSVIGASDWTVAVGVQFALREQVGEVGFDLGALVRLGLEPDGVIASGAARPRRRTAPHVTGLDAIVCVGNSRRRADAS